MGVLPLEFEPGTTRQTLGIDGSETYTIEGLSAAPAPGSILTLAITGAQGRTTRVAVKCRIDTHEECQVFEAGGLLPRIGRELRQAA
jgi:aconitate hydratase